MSAARWNILVTAVEPITGTTSAERIERKAAEFRREHKGQPGVQVRVYRRQVKAGGAVVSVHVLVVRRERASRFIVENYTAGVGQTFYVNTDGVVSWSHNRREATRIEFRSRAEAIAAEVVDGHTKVTKVWEG